MIVVTGAGRCGSSLMMQSLQLLGVPIFGDPWKEEANSLVNDIDCPESQEIKDNNPRGFFELPVAQLVEFLRMGNARFYPGYAVKVLAKSYTLLDSEDVDGTILCLRRSVKDQADSMKKLSELELAIQNNYGIDRLWNSLLWFKDRTSEDIENAMVQTNKIINKHIKALNKPALKVYFEDMLEDPEKHMRRVADFLNISDEHLHDAVNNVIRR